MAGLLGRAVTGQVALVTATVKTVLQLVAAANHRVKVPRVSISFEGVSTTDAPIQVDILRQTTAGTSASLTVSKDNSGDAETLQTSALQTFSAEPTAGDVLDSKLVHPQGRADFGPYVIPGGGRLGIRCTAPNGVDCLAAVQFEE